MTREERPATRAQTRSRRSMPVSSARRVTRATGQIATTANRFRHIATARAGTATAAINGPDVDTAAMPTAISSVGARRPGNSARQGRRGFPGDRSPRLLAHRAILP